METAMTLLFSFLIGLFAGLRSLTAPAACAWAVRLGWLKLERPLSLIGSLPVALILTVLAAAELVADKLPNTPKRTASLGLVGRVVTGGLTGACIGASGGRVVAGAILGVVGAVAGAFGGYQA